MNRRENQGSSSDDGFDRALRALHAEAVSHVSARTHTQLRKRLRSATTPVESHRHRWRLAIALATLVVVAGAYWHSSSLPDAPSPAAIANTGTDGGDLVAVIDETPDLYLWLDSDEATRLASE